MNKKQIKQEVAGVIFVSIAGTLAHFVYAISGENGFAALFVPVNESVWEHLKLLWFPYIIFAAVQFFLPGRKDSASFWAAKAAGAYMGALFIATFFYTYSGALGETVTAIDILSFYLGVLGAFGTDYVLMRSARPAPKAAAAMGIAALAGMTLLFFLFTYHPPQIALFEDPQSGSFGIYSVSAPISGTAGL